MCAQRMQWLQSLRENAIQSKSSRSVVAPPAPPQTQVNPQQKVLSWLDQVTDSPLSSACPSVSSAGFEDFKTTIASVVTPAKQTQNGSGGSPLRLDDSPASPANKVIVDYKGEPKWLRHKKDNPQHANSIAKRKLSFLSRSPDKKKKIIGSHKKKINCSPKKIARSCEKEIAERGNASVLISSPPYKKVVDLNNVVRPCKKGEGGNNNNSPRRKLFQLIESPDFQTEACNEASLHILTESLTSLQIPDEPVEDTAANFTPKPQPRKRLSPPSDVLHHSDTSQDPGASEPVCVSPIPAPRSSHKQSSQNKDTATNFTPKPLPRKCVLPPSDVPQHGNISQDPGASKSVDVSPTPAPRSCNKSQNKESPPAVAVNILETPEEVLLLTVPANQGEHINTSDTLIIPLETNDDVSSPTVQEVIMTDDFNVDDIDFNFSDNGFDNNNNDLNEEINLNENVVSEQGETIGNQTENAQQEIQRKPVTRTRQKNLSKQAKAKVALDRGLGHENVKGKLIKGRKMGPGCTQHCRSKCHDKVLEHHRKDLFEGFWAMGDKTRQQDFIRAHITVKAPHVHKTEENQKTNSIKYFFVVGGTMAFVCKTMFLQTFDISDSWVRTVVKKLKDGKGATILPDMRGRHSKVNPELKKKNEQNIKDHIESFKPVPSHLCRARCVRKYLDRRLNIRRLYNFYKEWMQSRRPGEQIKSEKFYRNIFNTRFNLGFHRPKKDLCDLCLVYDLSSARQKADLQDKMDEHLAHKAKAKAERKADANEAKKQQNECYAIFDLQKVLICPKTEASSAYYKRKLSVYDFTIYDVIRHTGFCYTWNENESARGANEIATCVLLFIEMMVEKGVKTFRFWSDNCGGQNKNKYIFSMYTFAAAKYDVIIFHKYLEKGHTMNEADSMHATIERKARYESVYDPDGWIQIMKDSKLEGIPYKVLSVGSKILDFHPLADKIQSWKSPLARWKHVRAVKVDHKAPGKVYLKHDFATPDFIEIKVTHSKGRPVNLANFKFLRAFNEQIPLKRSKLKDLATMCNELVIPSVNHGYYLELIGFLEFYKPLLPADQEAVDEAADNNVEPNAEDQEEEENEDEGPSNEDFLWGGDDDYETDYEEDLRNLRAAQPENNNGISEDEGGASNDEFIRAGGADDQSVQPESDNSDDSDWHPGR